MIGVDLGGETKFENIENASTNHLHSMILT